MRPLPIQSFQRTQGPVQVYQQPGSTVRIPDNTGSALVRLTNTALLQLPTSGRHASTVYVQVRTNVPNTFLTVPRLGSNEPFRIFDYQASAFTWTGKLWSVLYSPMQLNGGSVRALFSPLVTADGLAPQENVGIIREEVWPYRPFGTVNLVYAIEDPPEQ